jgi:hypothetical protein
LYLSIGLKDNGRDYRRTFEGWQLAISPLNNCEKSAVGNNPPQDRGFWAAIGHGPFGQSLVQKTADETDIRGTSRGTIRRLFGLMNSHKVMTVP